MAIENNCYVSSPEGICWQSADIWGLYIKNIYFPVIYWQGYDMFAHDCSMIAAISMDWFKGKSTGNHGFYHQI